MYHLTGAFQWIYRRRDVVGHAPDENAALDAWQGTMKNVFHVYRRCAPLISDKTYS